MAKDGKHVIHAGGTFPNPTLNREGPAALPLLPGTVGYFLNGQFTPSATGEEDAIFYIANIDYLRCKSVDDMYATGDLVVAMQPMPGMFFNVRATAAAYTKGQPVGILSGQAAASGGRIGVNAFTEETITAAADDLIRVVIK